MTKSLILPLICSLLPGLCFANSTAPYANQEAIVDTMFVAAMSSPSPDAAITALICIAEGTPEKVPPAIAGTSGMPTGEEDRALFRNVTVRVHSVQRLGESGNQVAFAYLQSLTSTGPTGTRKRGDAARVQWAAQVGLGQARLLNITSQQQKIEFLEGVLRGSGLGDELWSANQLCDMGSMPSLGLIEKLMRDLYSGAAAEDMIQYCEARIRVLASESDRGTALAKALRISGDQKDLRMINWAVAQLTELDTPAADAAIDQFAAQIRSLPHTSPESRNLAFVPSDLTYLRDHRSRITRPTRLRPVRAQ